LFFVEFIYISFYYVLIFLFVDRTLVTYFQTSKFLMLLSYVLLFG